MISYSVSSCVVHVKYCNHLLAADMAGVACRGLGVSYTFNVAAIFSSVIRGGRPRLTFHNQISLKSHDIHV